MCHLLQSQAVSHLEAGADPAFKLLLPLCCLPASIPTQPLKWRKCLLLALGVEQNSLPESP